MHSTLQELIDQLNLEKLGDLEYRGRSQNLGYARVFGGQVIAQALSAAQQTVMDRHIHSLHCYFLRPGDPQESIHYAVECIRDGKSFTTRRIVASQREIPIFSMSCSFQKKEGGFQHQAKAPVVPTPEELVSISELAKKAEAQTPERLRFRLKQKVPIEIRPVEPINYAAPSKRSPKHQLWIKAISPLPDDSRVHQHLLAYASDFALLETSLLPHEATFLDQNMQVASLDHAMWFHREFRLDEWLLYSMESPVAGNARGLSFGHIFDQQGALVASTAQEGLIRNHAR